MNRNIVYINNVQKILEEKEISINRLAKMSNLSRHTVASMLSYSNRYNPRLSTMCKVADALNVSLIDILSRDSVKGVTKKNDVEMTEYMMIYRDNIRSLLVGRSQISISVNSGLSPTTISYLLNKENYDPKINTLLAMSEFLGIRLDVLFLRGV